METILKKNMGSIAMLTTMVVATVLVATVSAQMNIPACATKLSACATYLNVTNPPLSCCTPLKDALTNDLPCMCKILTDKELLKGFGVDIQAAMQLPKRCGMTTFSTNACNTTADTPAASIPPPANPGGSNGASSRVAWTGMSGLTGLFLVWWSIIA